MCGCCCCVVVDHVYIRWLIVGPRRSVCVRCAALCCRYLFAVFSLLRVVVVVDVVVLGLRGCCCRVVLVCLRVCCVLCVLLFVVKVPTYNCLCVCTLDYRCVCCCSRVMICVCLPLCVVVCCSLLFDCVCSFV